jgi:hypothetical protein
MARDSRGGQSRGQPGDGQHNVQQHNVQQHNVQQHNVQQHNVQQQSVLQPGTGITRPSHREDGSSVGRTGDAGTNVRQDTTPHANPHFPVGGALAADSWRYRSVNGRWWYWTPQNRWMWYGDNGRWIGDNYSGDLNTYVVQRPISGNPLPEAAFSGGRIVINNPAANNLTLSYSLDGMAYAIAPGYRQELREDRAWVIQFSRGTNLNEARYSLRSGLYTFTGTNHGWDLYRSELSNSP